MYESNRILQALRQRRPGHTLPQPFYTAQDIYEFDLDAIFHRNWTMVGFEAELAQPGSYIAVTIGRTPILVIRNAQGAVVGFHNSCRHRGAQILPDGSGRTPRLVCPYHHWSYDLTGKLLSARGAPTGFIAEQHALSPIRVEVASGCIYVAQSSEAVDQFGPRKPRQSSMGGRAEQFLSCHQRLRFHVQCESDRPPDDDGDGKMVRT